MDVILPPIDGSGDCVVSFVVRVIQKDKGSCRSHGKSKKKIVLEPTGNVEPPPAKSFCDEILHSISVDKGEQQAGKGATPVDMYQFGVESVPQC